MSGFGQYDNRSGAGETMKPGVYAAEIVKADVKREQGGAVVKDRASGKVKFELIVRVSGPKHVGENLKRTMTVTFGQNQESGQYATFARFIETATGIPCGDPAQKAVGPDDLTGKKLSVMVKPGNGYNNIVDFLAHEEEDEGVLDRAMMREIIDLAKDVKMGNDRLAKGALWASSARQTPVDQVVQLTPDEATALIGKLRAAKALVPA